MTLLIKTAAKKPWSTLRQQGFTLLELLVAMAIFAVLAITGWQVFDNVNRSKQQAQTQTQALSQLQYGYQQVQRDMLQAVAYNQPSLQQNGFVLNDNVLSFIRYADPDPRFQEIPTLERIEYRFEEDRLLRLRYQDISIDSLSVPNKSQIVGGIERAQIQVLLPEPSRVFPEDKEEDQTLDISAIADSISVETQAPTLPKGIAMAFTMQLGKQSLPIEWRFALPAMAPSVKVEPESDP